MSNPIEQAREAVRENSRKFNAALDRIRRRRTMSEEERKAMIFEGYHNARRKHAELMRNLRDARTRYRAELEHGIFRPDRPSTYNGLRERPLEVMSVRDAKARARAAQDAEELREILEDALAIGDDHGAHAAFVEANRRAPSEHALGEIAGDQLGGEYVEAMRRYLAYDQDRAAKYEEWVSLGEGEQVAGDVVEAFSLMPPKEPDEIKGYRPPAPEEVGNPFEAEPERVGAQAGAGGVSS